MELVQFNNFKPEYSPNLLGVASLLRSGVIVSGTGNANIDTAFGYSKNSNSVYLNSTYNINVGLNETFSLGTALSSVALKDGIYIFQFSVLNNTNYGGILNANLTLEVYINGLLANTFVNTLDLMTLQNKTFYNFTQSFEVIEGQEVNYVFKVNGAYPGNPAPILKLYFSGFKLEVDDRKLNTPTIYDEPLQTIEQTLNLDFPNIVAGGFAILESTVLGVTEFDRVALSTSFVASNSGLIFQAYASNTNKVTVIARNVTGLAIDLVVSNFKIKITK